MKTRRPILLGVAVVALLAFTLGGIAAVRIGGVLNAHPEGGAAPAPDADEAPLATAPGQKPGPATVAQAKPEWPDNFNLSLDIPVTTPDVPVQLEGATAQK